MHILMMNKEGGMKRMIEIDGKHAKAKVFTDKLEQDARNQILELCNQKFTKGSKIRIMPDVHSGKGCVIGLTMTFKDKVVPNLVGVDIGCGISAIKINEKRIDFNKLEKIITKQIPSGFAIRQKVHKTAKDIPLEELKCIHAIDRERAMKSVGTLGGGNHFLEAGRDKNHNIWFFVHSGSRHLGNQIATHYQKLAIKKLKKKVLELENPNLAYLEGEDTQNYLHDVKIAQQYALKNREAMLYQILDFMDVTSSEEIVHTIHNYIDVDKFIVRKGAISAEKDEMMMIPMNMRDGMLLCRGKGNSDWNFSAPHGAGRIMSRTKAKNVLELEAFKESMAGIWSQSVRTSTLDEAPMVYKPMEEILSHIGETVEVVDIIKPIYNYKAH